MIERIPKYLLSLAGEYRVCSELNKLGIFATVTYGNRKSVDVYAISDRHERALKIEVKTAQQRRFVTRITQKDLANDPHAPDFWVLFQIGLEAGTKDRFFVLTHKEICAVQAAGIRRSRTVTANDTERSLIRLPGWIMSLLRTLRGTKTNGPKSWIDSAVGPRASSQNPCFGNRQAQLRTHGWQFAGVNHTIAQSLNKTMVSRNNARRRSWM